MVAGYDFPVWGTQGGSLVRWNAATRRHIFITTPDSSDLNIGDAMPEEWVIIASNDHARRANEEALDFQIALGEFFEALFDKVDDSNVTVAQAKHLFPSDVRKLH